MGWRKWAMGGIGVAAIGGAVAFAQYRNIETPSHEVVLSDGDFELRDYAPMIVAEVTHTGDRNRASGASFRRLAAYIFGNDRPAGGDDIAMTAPVLQERVDQNAEIAMTAPVIQESAQGDTWTMRFVMPSEYTMETLPQPPSDIALKEVPGRRIAAIRFNGNGNARDLAEMEARLSDWISDQELSAVGQVQYAFYDAPMVPGPLRRNEVLIEVAAE